MTIEIDVTHHYKGFDLATAFTAPAAGITSFFGPSGAGKTTLINMIAGLVRPQSGRISIGGETLFDSAAGIDLPARERRIGYVFQESRLFPHLTVAGNLDYGAKRRGGTDPANRNKLIELLGIGHLLDRRPANLSGGERQRVAIARALLAAPRILLLDEPMASLDPARRQEVSGLLEQIRRDTGVPMIHVSHSIDEVARLADTVVLFNRGEVIASGPVGDVMTRLDLFPLTGRFEAGAVIDGTLAHHDPKTRMSAISFAGGTLLVPELDAAPDTPVRLRIRARDVMIANTPPEAISANNILDATVTGMREEDGPHLDIQLDCGGVPLLARITAASRDRLSLKPGKQVSAIIKSLNIDRRAAR